MKMVLRCLDCSILDVGASRELNISFWSQHFGHNLLNTKVKK